MYLESRRNVYTFPQLNPGTAGLLGTTQRVNLDRTWPIEEILIFLTYTVTVAYTQTAIGAGLTTPDQWENVLNILNKINLTINDGRQPRTVVDVSGVRLLEYCAQTGINLDRSAIRHVQMAYQHAAAGTPIPVGVFQLCYRLPMASPLVGEPLRSRLYLPVHTHPQDPVLTLSFNTTAAMGLAAGTIGQLGVDIMLLRREPTVQSEKLLQSTAGSNPTGYIDWDLIETPYTVPAGVGAEQRFIVPSPGNYVNLLMSQYRSNSAAAGITKNSICALLGDTAANGLGNETLWRIETGLQVKSQWRFKHLRAINDWSRPLNNVMTNAAGAAAPDLVNISPDFNQNMAATSLFPGNGVTMLDFLNDTTGDSGNELGSLLDCNSPVVQGLKMEIIGTPIAGNTQPHYFNLLGYRLLGDISRWQKF